MKSNYFKLMFLLSKRLFKKVSFVIILCLIPIIALSFKMLSDEESGIVRIALCNEGNDRDASRVVDSLLNRSSVFLYTEVEDADEAEELIRDGVVDGAWIFPKDYGNRIDDYTKGLIDNSNKTENVVTVYQSEDSILLNLSRMELFGALYSDLSYSLYDNYINIKNRAVILSKTAEFIR